MHDQTQNTVSGEPATIANGRVQEVHVDRAVLFVALVLGSNAVACKRVPVSDMPHLKRLPSGKACDRLICQTLAPAFVRLLDEPDTSVDAQTTLHMRQVEAATAGLMRVTLLWPNSDRVSRGAVTRHLQSGVGVHAAWSVLQATEAKRKSAWWASHVVPALVDDLKLGSWQQAGDGWGYQKPSRAELAASGISEKLMLRLQLPVHDILKHLAATPALEADVRRGAKRASSMMDVDADGDGAEVPFVASAVKPPRCRCIAMPQTPSLWPIKTKFSVGASLVF